MKGHATKKFTEGSTHSEEQKEGHIDDTDSFVRFHSVVENDIKKYKATAKAGAQAKLNATHSGIDMRNGLFDNI